MKSEEYQTTTTDGKPEDAREHACMVALNEKHFRMFFGDGLEHELRQAVSRLEKAPWGGDGRQVVDAIIDQRPDILVTGWSTPRLDPAVFAPEGPVRYVCSVTGSIRPNIPVELIERGLIVTNWGTSISRTVAECALMMILMSLRCTAEHHDHIRAGGRWGHIPSGRQQLSLFGRNVGLHGFGKVARELVHLLRPFNPVISAYCPSAAEADFQALGVRRASSLEELFSQNVILVELEGLTPETYHSVTEPILRLLPDESVLVNVGRGAVIDEAALARVASEGKIRVALDVFEQEPLPADSPLRNVPGVILTPHIAGPTADRVRDSGAHAVQNIRNYTQGLPLSGRITPALYRLMT